MKITKAIKNKKRKLKKRAKENGIYENFGQKEVRKLKDRFNYNPYGNEKDRFIAKMIDNFNNWCVNFNLSDL